jgi:undecaprenyl-diphosphatase
MHLPDSGFHPTWSRPVAFWLGIFVVVSVLMVLGVTQAADVQLVQATAAIRTPGMIRVMQWWSNVGNWKVEIPFALLVAGLLWRARQRTSAWRFVAVGTIGEAFYGLLKLAFRRPRPVGVHLSQAGGYSYPSGHTMLAVIIWSLGLMLLAHLANRRWQRAALWTMAVAMPLLIAVSRVYLGVHYPTDVVAGLAMGMAWVAWWRGVMADG